jgi:hypothetical protein
MDLRISAGPRAEVSVSVQCNAYFDQGGVSCKEFFLILRNCFEALDE